MSIDETKVPADMLEEYAPEDVRGNWASLADMVERRKVELAYFISRLQEAHTAQAVASHKLYLRLGSKLTDQVEDAMREASGFERLYQAVEAAGLWPVIEDRDRSAEEIELSEQCIAKMQGEEAGR